MDCGSEWFVEFTYTSIYAISIGMAAGRRSWPLGRMVALLKPKQLRHCGLNVKYLESWWPEFVGGHSFVGGSGDGIFWRAQR